MLGDLCRKHHKTLYLCRGPTVLSTSSKLWSDNGGVNLAVMKICQQMATLQQRGVLPPLWCCRCLPRQPHFMSCWGPAVEYVSSFLVLLSLFAAEPLISFSTGEMSLRLHLCPTLVPPISTIYHCCSCCHAVFALLKKR